jgi:ferredoxin
MDTFFVSKLKPLMDEISKQKDLYIPKRAGDHFVFNLYDGSKVDEIPLNNIRACTPVKEFLFPVRELAATYPQPLQPQDIRPFAVFGLKDCDLKSIAVLDKVFTEEDFEDPLYIARREKMFIISSDCLDPGDSCFCCLFDGKVYPETGYDLNISQIKDGFIVEAGSKKGVAFTESNHQLFADVPKSLLEERDQNRQRIQKQLEEANSKYDFSDKLGDAVDATQESTLYDEQAEGCIECQACTRVCPTCHCFYLYDTKAGENYTRMKIWDSCMRFTYATVAGGANPNKILGDRMKHRLMHKFVHFAERYGINMCVGCGRCVDADAGGMDLREILNRLSKEAQNKTKEKTKK